MPVNIYLGASETENDSWVGGLSFQLPMGFLKLCSSVEGVWGEERGEEGRQRGMVRQIGMKREYHLLIPEVSKYRSGAATVDQQPEDFVRPDSLIWKGTMSAVKQVDQSSINSKSSSPCHGNLKLFRSSDPHKLLGLWENKTDWPKLGNLMLFEEFREGDGLEGVIASYTATVLFERVTYRGLVGGLFSRARPENGKEDSQ